MRTRIILTDLRAAATRSVLVAAMLVAAAPPMPAQQRPVLGPVDSAGLPPLDTGRVAVGTPAPDFTLESKDGGTVTLSQFRGKKAMVLVFYRGHW